MACADPVHVPAWLIEPLLHGINDGTVTLADARRRVDEYVELEEIAAAIESQSGRTFPTVEELGADAPTFPTLEED